MRRTRPVNYFDGGDTRQNPSTRPTTPPRTGLYSPAGRLIRWIEPNTLDATHPYFPYLEGHRSPQFGVLKAADVVEEFMVAEVLVEGDGVDGQGLAGDDVQGAVKLAVAVDIDQLLARIMDMIFDWVEADRGCIMLKDLETGKLTPKVRRHRRGVRPHRRRGHATAVPDELLANGEDGSSDAGSGDESWPSTSCSGDCRSV